MIAARRMHHLVASAFDDSLSDERASADLRTLRTSRFGLTRHPRGRNSYKSQVGIGAICPGEHGTDGASIVLHMSAKNFNRVGRISSQVTEPRRRGQHAGKPQRTSVSVDRTTSLNEPRNQCGLSNGPFLPTVPRVKPLWSFNSRIGTVTSQQNFSNIQRPKLLK